MTPKKSYFSIEEKEKEDDIVLQSTLTYQQQKALKLMAENMLKILNNEDKEDDNDYI